ncbi:MAG: amino acid ABC transporter substrate-binding protein [Oscillochloris sp.]|nr:amino acid ABC transporter substrate-binding protein [Oscillochloris sp.]
MLALLAGCLALPPAPDSEGVITFGAAISLTGKTFKEGEYVRDGYLLAIETINAAGGLMLNGRRHTIELIYYDDESRPERTAELVERLIVEDKIDLLLGPYGSEPTEAAAAVAERYRVPMVEANGAAEQIFSHGYRYTFGLQTPAPAYLCGVIDLVRATAPSIQRVAIIAKDESFSREVARSAADCARTQGMDLVYSGYYPAELQDVSPWLVEIKAARPDLLLGAGHLQDALLVVRQARGLGIKPRAMGFSVGPSSPQFRRNLGAAADYVFGATQWTSALPYHGDDLWGTPAAYADAFYARFPHYREIPYQAAESSASLVVYQHVLEQIGQLDREAVRDALAAIELDTFFGPIRFDARGMNSSKPMVIEQWHPDGRKYTVFPLELAERAAIYPATRP